MVGFERGEGGVVAQGKMGENMIISREIFVREPGGGRVKKSGKGPIGGGTGP